MADTSGSAGEVRVKLALDVGDLRTQLDTAEKNLGRRRGIPLKVSLEPQTVTAAVNKGTGAAAGLKPVTLKASITGDEVRKAANKGIDSAKGRGKKLPIDVMVSSTQVTEAADAAIDKARPKKLVVDIEYRVADEASRYAEIATRTPRRPPSSAMGGPVRRISMPPRRAGGGPVGPLNPTQIARVAAHVAEERVRIPIGARSRLGPLGAPGTVYVDPRTGLFVDAETGRVLSPSGDTSRRVSTGPPRRPPVYPTIGPAPQGRFHGPSIPPDFRPPRLAPTPILYPAKTGPEGEVLRWAPRLRSLPGRSYSPLPTRPRVTPIQGVSPFPSGRSHPPERGMRGSDLLLPQGLRGEEQVPVSTFGTPGYTPGSPGLQPRRLSRARRAEIAAAYAEEQRRRAMPAKRVAGGTPEIGYASIDPEDPDTVVPFQTGRIRMPGMRAMSRPQGLAHSIYGDPRQQFAGPTPSTPGAVAHQRGEIYFDPKGGPKVQRTYQVPGGQEIAVASKPTGAFGRFTPKNRPVVESRVAQMRRRAREADAAAAANAGGWGVSTGTSMLTGGIEPELTKERKDWIEATNQVNRKKAKDARIEFQRRVETARRTDPTEMRVHKVNQQLALWHEYQREKAQHDQGFAITSRPEAPPELNPFEGRPAYAEFVKGGGTFSPFSLTSARQMPDIPLFHSPFQRMSMVMPSMGRFFKAWEDFQEKPTPLRGARIGKLSGQMTAQFMDRIAKQIKGEPLANTAMQRHLTEQYRLGLIEAYDYLVEGGHISGEGDLDKKGRDWLKAQRKLGLGMTKTSLPRRRRATRNPKRDELSGVIYDEHGEPMVHLDGPMAGQIMLRISPADLLQPTAMGISATMAAQPVMADQLHKQTQEELAAYEAGVRARWKKEGRYGSSERLEPNKFGRWTLSDPRFKEFFKNDSERQRLHGVLADLQRVRFRQENAGERLKSKAMGGRIGSTPLPRDLAKIYEEQRQYAKRGLVTDQELIALAEGLQNTAAQRGPSTRNPMIDMYRRRRAMGGGVDDPLEMPSQGGWWSKATNMAANAARTRYWERGRGMLGRLPGSPISFGEILGRASVSESREIGRSTPPFLDDLRGSWTRELDAMGWVRGREGPFPGAQAMPEGLPMQWTKGFTSDAYKSKLWQKFQAGDPESRQVMGALAGIRGRYPAREGFEDFIPDPKKIPRNAMGGALGRRLAQAKIQKAYDEGRYEEGQALQRELEASLGGWGGPAKPQMMSPFMEMRSKGMLPPKDMTRAMGGPLRRAGMGMTQLAPNWSGGVMPMLAMHPDAVLVGEHGPEVFVPDTGGMVYPNHYNGGYLPQFHAGGRLGPHPHPHRSDREGREVFFSERTGRWHQVGDPHRFGGQPMVRGPLGGGTYPTRSQRERAMSRMQRTGELFGPNAGSGRLTTFDVPASADPLNDPRTRRDYEAGLVDRTGRPPRTTGVVMPDDRTVQAPGQIQMFGPIGAFAQQPPIQGANVNVAGAQAQAPQAAGQQPPGQPAQQPVMPPAGGGGRGGGAGNPNRAGGPPPPVRLPRVSPAQRQRGFITAQLGLQDIFSQIEEVRQEASNALQLSPVRALSVSVGQIFQEAFGGRRGIRTRKAEADRAAAEAATLAGRLQTQVSAAAGLGEQRRETGIQARAEKLATGAVSIETRARLRALRERQISEEAGAAELRPSVERATIRAQILERGAGQAAATSQFGRQRVRAVAAEMRAGGERTGGILTPLNLLQAQAIGLGGIVLGTKIFTAGIQLVDAALAKFNEALAPAIDATTGYTNTANMVAEQLASVAGGGTGGAAEIAGAQAKIGLATATPEIERRARLLAGAQNFEQIQAQIRAEQNLGGRRSTQGVFEGFNNGPLAGVPLLGSLFGWVGQTQSMAQRLEGVGRRSQLAPVGFLQGLSEDQFAQLTQAGLAETGAGGTRQFTGVPTLRQIAEALPGSGETPTTIAMRLGLPGSVGLSNPDMQVPGTGGPSPAQQDQIDQVNAMWAEVNDNLDKVDANLGDFVVTLEQGTEISKKTAQEFRDRGLDLLADIIEDFGIEFVDKGGNFVDRVADAMDAASLGASFQDPARILTSMTPAITAQIRGIMREAAFQRETVIPAQLSRQLIAQPQPTSGRVGLIPSGVGNFTGLGMLEEAATRVEGLRGDLAAMALTDQQLTDMLGVPQGVIDGVRDIGEEIRRLSEIDQDLQLGQEQEQYNEQLRISRRSIGDLVGLVGRQSAAYSRLVSVQDSGARVFDQQVIAATEYGRLQRAQIADSRQLSQIQLARSQRELNLQLALARLRSPGETAAERAVRRREAEALARSQQRELDINRRTTRRGFRIEDIGFGRQLGDALRAQGLAESERTINLRVRGSQAVQEALRTIQQQKLAFLDLSITVGTQIEEAAMRVQQTIEEASGQYLDDFEREVKRTMRIITREAIASYDEAKATIVGPVETPVETHRPGRTGPQDVGGQASGLMAYVNTPTSFIAGEAGAEQVLVIRNPKAGMLGGGGGGGRNVTININASVRDDRDVDSLVRKVIREIHQQAELVG